MPSQWQRWAGIMKCYPFEEKRLAKWEPPYIVQPKYDGVRCRAVPIDNTIDHWGAYLLLSSEENIVFSVPHINEELNNTNLDIELDGELYCHEMSFEEILSITSRTVNLHYEHKNIKLHVFDVVNDRPQHTRLVELIRLRGLKLNNIEVSPHWICDTLDEIKRVYDKLISLDYEGIVVRHKDAPYETKRSTWIMKFKPKKKDKYDIVGWKEEVSKDGVPKGRIGSIIFSSQQGDTFGVSAGLDDSDRERLWATRETLAGRTGIVHYQHLTNKKIPKGTFNVEVVE